MNTHDALVQSINRELALELPEQLSATELKKQLAAYINHLIHTDFEKLIYYFYRIDVNEIQIKQLLQNPHENTGDLIAGLLIERQLQKIRNRRESMQQNDMIDEDEKW